MRAHLTPTELLDLVNGAGTREERDAGLAHARTCAECEMRLRQASADRARAELEVPSVLAALEHRRAASMGGRGGGSRRWWPAVVGVAAAVLVVWTLGPGRAKPAWTHHLRALPAIEPVVQRGREATPELACLETAIRTYARRSYAEAAHLLGRCDASGADETLRDLYRGSALAFDARYREAIEVLDRVPVASIPAGWQREMKWTRCIAAFGRGRTREGDSLLKALEPIEPSERERIAGLQRMRNRPRR